MMSFSVALVVLTLSIKNLVSQEFQTCAPISSARYNVQWPSTNNSTISNPPCVNHNKEFVTRKCSNGVWDPEPECDYVQEQNPRKCPDAFIEPEEYDFCYQISKHKTKFPPECLYRDILPFETYRDLIDNNGPFWMPVARNFDNDFGLFQWLETSYLYKTAFEGRYYHDGTSKNKNCLLYYNSSYIEAVSCDEEHLSICVYKKFDQIVNSLCSSKHFCAQSDFINKTKCFCTDTEDSDYPKAEFLQLYQNNVFGKLTNETCAIALQHSDNTYIWSDSDKEINYTYWSTATIFDSTRIYGASTPNGWILTEEQPTCSLVQKNIEKPNKPVLELIEMMQLQLTVYYNTSLKKVDSNLFLYCFTDASALDLVYRYTNFTQGDDYDYYDYDDDENLTYNIDPLEDGPGNYWCESFDYVAMEIVKSRIKFFTEYLTNGYEFVAILRIHYENSNFATQNIIRFIDSNIFANLYQLDHFKNSYNLRIMKIIDADEAKQEVLTNIHLTAINVTNDQHDEEYKIVKKLLEENLPQLQVKMIEFSTVDYCLSEVTANLHWPSTSSGEKNTSEEYCFKSDGTRLSRLCQADFLNGAKWATLNETCKIAKPSSLTPKLMEAVQTVNAALLLDISKKYDSLSPLDIYLYGNVFQTYAEAYEVALDLDTFTEIISNLMEVNESVLIESKLKMKATETILDAIFKYFMKTQDIYISCQKNFFAIAKFVYTMGGFYIKKRSADYCTNGIEDLNSGYDINEIMKSDVEAAFLINENVNSQSSENAIILVFLKNSFFIENPATKTFGNVYRIIVQGLDDFEPLNGPSVLLQSVDNDTQMNCSFWDTSGDSTGFWQKFSDSGKLDSYQSCNFTDTLYFALTQTEAPSEENVTISLTDILESDISVSEKISRLQKVSRRYQEFVSVDVSLVGKIFEQVNQNSDIDLEALAETVNNLQQIRKEVLRVSQVEENSTDHILYFLDKILKNHNYQKPVQVVDDNFMTLIYDIKETNFSGLLLLEYNQTYQFKILEGDIDISEISGYENLNSAVVLSPELKGQLNENSRVIVTFFSSDALFNEQKSEFKSVSKIFGVILPEIGAYSGPITVLQKVAKNDFQEQCVHWNYAATVPGSWLKDQDGKELSSLVECEFWHTTHFAVLVVDKDKYQDDQVLGSITNICCFLSFLGLFCIFLTAALFKKWRQNAGNKILLNFAFSMLLQIVLFYVSSYVNVDSNNVLLCTIVGMLLHYIVVSVFCWMLVIAFLQYKRFVQVLGGPSQHILLKGCLLGWLFPLCPVTLVAVFGNYNDLKYSNVALCYPSGLSLYLGVWLPGVSMILINLAVFASIIHSVFNKKTDRFSGANGDLIFQWRLAFLLFFILGLSWVFGFLSMLDFGVVFVYLFSMTGTLQGFVLFLFFVVFNSNTRFLYIQACKRHCYKN